MEVSVREIKNRLSEYLRRVQAGEEIVITSRGRPIARLAPPAARSEDTEAEAIARLRAQPWIRPGSGGKPRGSERPVRIGAGEKTLSEIVSELRD
jgi:prevent-host-death family protein